MYPSLPVVKFVAMLTLLVNSFKATKDLQHAR